MLPRLLFLLIAIPLVELVLLLLLAEATNWVFTVLFVLATGALGAILAKQQGLAAFRGIRQDLSFGRMPSAAVLDAVLILAAGVLLLTPGVLSDLLGISLLIPPVRRRYKRWLRHWYQTRFLVRSASGDSVAPRRSEVIDSYVVEGTRREAPRDARGDNP